MVGLEGMESRTLEVTIVSTEVVQSVKCMSWWEKLKRERRKKREQTFFLSMWVDPMYRYSTSMCFPSSVDVLGEPVIWNKTLSFPVPEYFLRQEEQQAQPYTPLLTVEISARSSFLGTRSLIGTARIPLREILPSPSPPESINNHEHVSTYQLLRNSGRRIGSVCLSVGVSGKTPAAAPSPPVAYPYYGPPPPPPPHAYAGYVGGGAGWPPSGYVQQPEYVPRPTTGFGSGGMGFGTGMLAGALGGLLVGDMLDNDGLNDGNFGGYDGNFGGYDGFGDGGMDF